jgi:hypothetical protein
MCTTERPDRQNVSGDWHSEQAQKYKAEIQGVRLHEKQYYILCVITELLNKGIAKENVGSIPTS